MRRFSSLLNTAPLLVEPGGTKVLVLPGSFQPSLNLADAPMSDIDYMGDSLA